MPTRRANGFTLVEILVTVGIMAVLAGLLFPVYARVKEKGRRAACQNNLHQIALAMQQYVQDSDGYYPSDGSVDEYGRPTRRRWFHAIAAYLKNDQVFICPNYPPRPSLSPDDPMYIQSITTYDYDSSRLNVWESVANPMSPQQESKPSLRNVSTIWLNRCVGRTDVVGAAGDEWIETTSSCGRIFRSHTPTTFHSGGTNYSFLDGHVKWLTLQQIADIQCSNSPMRPGFPDY